MKQSLLKPLKPGLEERVAMALEGVLDGATLIVKAHMFLEQVLFEQVSSKCSHPQHLERAQLRFFQLVNLARAMHSGVDTTKQALTVLAVAGGMDRIWDGLEAVNTLRNRFAHEPSPKNLLPLLKRLPLDMFAEEPASLSDSVFLSILSANLGTLLAVIWSLYDADE